VARQARVSATAIGGSVFVCVAGCLGTRVKAASADLATIQESFRATAVARASQRAVAAAEAETREVEMSRDADDMAASRAAEGTVGATTTGHVGIRYDN
jgi:hypothetical protein